MNDKGTKERANQARDVRAGGLVGAVAMANTNAERKEPKC